MNADRERFRRWQALRALACTVLLLLGALVAQAADPCLQCHGLPGFGVDGSSLWVHDQSFAAGLHGALSCEDCHKGASVYPHRADHRVRCDLLCHVPGASHEALAAQEEGGVHAAVAEPPCLGCHRGGRGEPLACRRCHGEMRPVRPSYPDTPGAFGDRAHAKVGEGRRAPDCVDCHGTHGVKAGRAARASCDVEGCHAGAPPAFGELFDHGKGRQDANPLGTGTVFLALLAGVGALLFTHALRR